MAEAGRKRARDEFSLQRMLGRVTRTGSRELFTLAVLAVALGIATGAAGLFGVSFALGAFFAGVVVSESDFSHEAATSALPLRDAFAVLFFVSVGMLFDPRILVRQPVEVLAVVLIVLIGKSLASLAIVLDQPFVVGDFVVLGDKQGTVERIGIKTTRLRSLSGEELIIANADLLASRIHNFRRMAQRRVVFTIGVTYQTPADKLEKLPGMLRVIVEAEQLVRFDRAHFARYGEFALVYEVVYWMLSADFNAYMDTQQRINLAIYRRVREEGIAFAYPTQTVHLRSAAEAAPAAA